MRKLKPSTWYLVKAKRKLAIVIYCLEMHQKEIGFIWHELFRLGFHSPRHLPMCIVLDKSYCQRNRVSFTFFIIICF